MKHILEDRRLGRFVIPLEFINGDPNAVRIALAGVIVVQSDVRIASDDIEYFGICDEFSQVESGSIIPTYKAVLRKGDDGNVSLVRWSVGSDLDVYVGNRKIT